VRLDQPQYQAAELLIGVMSRGFRVVERPATIHRRKVGESKKGHNAIYGLHFLGVISRTWWRERVLGGGSRRNRPGHGTQAGMGGQPAGERGPASAAGSSSSSA